jgi:hypothetical protein
MNQELRNTPPSKSPLIGMLTSWGIGVFLFVAFVIAWLVRMDAPWVVEVIESVFPELVHIMRDNF